MIRIQFIRTNYGTDKNVCSTRLVGQTSLFDQTKYELNHLRKSFLLFLLLLGLNSLGAKANYIYQDNSSTFSVTKESDSLKTLSLEKAMKTQTPPTKPYEMAKSPTWAIIQSLILPGLGQFYNEAYWKAPIFLGGAGTLTYFIIADWKQYDKFQKIYDNSTTQLGKDTSNNYKEFYRDRRDKLGFYLLGVYILAAVDAYVGAHLFDFDVSDEKVTFSISPNQYKGVSFNLYIKF
jgi:hypothetical protein